MKYHSILFESLLYIVQIAGTHINHNWYVIYVVRVKMPKIKISLLGCAINCHPN